MTDDEHTKERTKKVQSAIELLPSRMQEHEVIALLCTIAGMYAEPEDGMYAAAPMDSIYFLKSALEAMMSIRGLIDETETDTMH